MAGISEPGLIASGFSIQSRRLSRRVLRRTGRDRPTAHQVRQIRTEASVGGRAADRVTIDAGGRFEHSPAGQHLVVLRRGLLLRANPRVKVLGTVHDDAQEHLGVLRPAVLRALTEKHAGPLRVHPHLVDAIRNQVGLAGQLRNPEAVVGVGGKQLQVRRAPTVRDRSPECAARLP